jgi:small subunit ribosomal protein S6
MNIECGRETLEELENAFRFNDAVMRNLIVTQKQAVTSPSPLAKPDEKEEAPSGASRSDSDNG